MKTPKRQAEEWERFICKERLRMNEQRIKYSRWKRKNRIAQLKRTIARLEKEKIDAYLTGYADACNIELARKEKE